MNSIGLQNWNIVLWKTNGEFIPPRMAMRNRNVLLEHAVYDVLCSLRWIDSSSPTVRRYNGCDNIASPCNELSFGEFHSYEPDVTNSIEIHIAWSASQNKISPNLRSDGGVVHITSPFRIRRSFDGSRGTSHCERGWRAGSKISLLELGGLKLSPFAQISIFLLL